MPVLSLLSVLIAVLFLGVPFAAAQVRVPNGTMVRLKVHYDLTTENVDKGDRVEFDVAEDVVVNNRVVIQRGSVAWGQVVEVKGAGKKKAKDASVTFRFVSVRGADNQMIPLRLLPSKPKDDDDKLNRVEINTPILGLRERMIGAGKGREFAAYTNIDALVNAPERAATPPPAPAAAAPVIPDEPDAFIDFNSVPPGCEIVIDGSVRGTTPTKFQVPPGRHVIEIRISGYGPWTRNMVVDPGSKPSIRAVLERE